MSTVDRPTGSGSRRIRRVEKRVSATADDVLAVEEPLEIQIGYGPVGDREFRAVSITMRTPGDDFELAAGFLYSEGIIAGPDSIEEIRHCGLPTQPSFGNTVRVELQPGLSVDLARLERHFYTTSSCGVCGKTSIEALRAAREIEPPPLRHLVSPRIILGLPARLRANQAIFDRTGGLHAAACFGLDGELHSIREDVGRHNALDKVVGAELLAGSLPLHERILLVSGRVSFELVQKAAMAGFPAMAAVGAPSTLAIELASSCGMLVCGFVRDDRFNVYCGEERLAI